MAAIALTAALGGWGSARHRGAVGGLVLVAGVALVLLVAGLVARRPTPIVLAAVGLGILHLIDEVGHPIALGATALFAVALLLMLELAWWSTELAVPVTWEPSTSQRQWWFLLALAVGGGVLALVVGLAALAARESSTALFVAATVAVPLTTWAIARWAKELAAR